MRQRLLIVATAILLVGIGSTSLPRIEAQVVGSLTGTVCASDPSPSYEGGGATGAAPPPTYPEKRGCAGVLPQSTVRLTRTGVAGSVPALDRTATTDADGRFTFDTLPNGEGYTLEATHAHFTKAAMKVAVNGTTVQDVSLVGDVFQQSGRTVDGKGRGVAGATVTTSDDSGQRPPARSGADGSFTLTVRAGYRSVSVADAPGFESLYEYRLLDGSDLTLALTALPAPDAFVTGTVRDQDGNPVPDIRIDAWSSQPCCPEPMPAIEPAQSGGSTGAAPSSSVVRPYYGGSNHTRTDAQGNYRIGVFAGQVSLNVNSGADPDERFAAKTVTLDVARGETATQDVRLMRYPPRTAHIEGQVTGGGKGLAAVMVSVRSPEYGRYECSTNALGDGPVYATMAAEDAVAPSSYPIREAPPCAITIDADGRFSGDVTPGYAIIDVSYQIWQACPQAPDKPYAPPSCTPDYYAWTTSTVLAKDATTRLDVELTQRPGPDAVVSGYAVDAATGKAIAGATLWFSNQEQGAYGQAVTDADGSYKVRLRSGYHQVGASVYTSDGRPGGYLSWQGILQVPAGEHGFDIKLQPGEESYGGCCWVYPMLAEGKDAAVAPGAPASPGVARTGQTGATQGGETASAQEFEDLGGGLGEYDPAKRSNLLQPGEPGKASPGDAVLAVLAALALLAATRRRKA